MSRALYSFAKWCVGILPVDPAGRRCFDETLADWRSEAGKSSGPAASGLVTARALWSVARCVVMISSREARSREGLASLRRLALWSAASVSLFVLFNWNRSIPVAGIQKAMGPTALLMASVSWVVALMPLLAFVSAAWGRRSAPPVPRVGPAVVAGLLMLGAMGWAMPAANQAWRELVFGLSGGQGALPPGINERSLIELIGMTFSSDLSRSVSALNLRAVYIVAVPVLLVLGLTARSLTGRWRLVATLVPVLAFGIPMFAQIETDRFVLMWPAMLAAVLLTRFLVRGAARETGAVA